MQLIYDKIVVIATNVRKDLYTNCSSFISKGGAIWKVVRL